MATESLYNKPRKKAKVRKLTKKDVKMVFSELKESLTGIDQCWCLTYPEAHYSDCPRCSATLLPNFWLHTGWCDVYRFTMYIGWRQGMFTVWHALSFSKTMFNTAPSHNYNNPHHTAVWKYNCVLGPLVMSGHSANSVGSIFASFMIWIWQRNFYFLRSVHVSIDNRTT